jgi:hypothetical protein
MPVSKKRMKDGKPVHRRDQAHPSAEQAGAEHPSAPEAKVAAPQVKAVKPSNPFTAQRQLVRSAQRGR